MGGVVCTYNAHVRNQMECHFNCTTSIHVTHTHGFAITSSCWFILKELSDRRLLLLINVGVAPSLNDQLKNLTPIQRSTHSLLI